MILVDRWICKITISWSVKSHFGCAKVARLTVFARQIETSSFKKEPRVCALFSPCASIRSLIIVAYTWVASIEFIASSITCSEPIIELEIRLVKLSVGSESPAGLLITFNVFNNGRVDCVPALGANMTAPMYRNALPIIWMLSIQC